MFGNSRSRIDTARRNPLQRRSKETVSAVLAAAAQIFGERGFQRSTTNHIAERAGVSIGSLYQYFPDKPAIAAALELLHLEEAGVAMESEARRLAEVAPRPEAWASAFVRRLVAINDSELHRVLYETAPPLPGVREHLETIVAKVALHVAAYLRRRHLRASAMRARVIVVTAIALVHELVMVAAPSTRVHARREIEKLLAAYLTTS
jgi:AcrR family transcriptional regulator